MPPRGNIKYITLLRIWGIRHVQAIPKRFLVIQAVGLAMDGHGESS